MPVCTYVLLHVACVYPMSVFSNVCASMHKCVAMSVRIHRVGPMDLRMYAFLCTSHINMCSMCKSCSYLWICTSAYYYTSVFPVFSGMYMCICMCVLYVSSEYKQALLQALCVCTCIQCSQVCTCLFI